MDWSNIETLLEMNLVTLQGKNAEWQKQSDDNLKFMLRQQRLNNLNAEIKETDVKSFISNNVGKDKYKPQDFEGLKQVAKTGRATERYLPRFKYIMSSALTKRTFRQSVEEKNITNQSNEILGLNDNEGNFKHGAQGGWVVVDASYLPKILAVSKTPELYKDLLKRKGNVMVQQKEAREAKVPTKTKSSDFWLADSTNGSLFVTFKSVENQGGAQKNQVNDVLRTVQTLKNNIRLGADKQRAVAVIRGKEALKYLRPDPKNHCVYYDNEKFNNKKVMTRKKKTIYIPTIMTEGQWLSFLNIYWNH